VMTATPIPRTMALFIYGDLDISIIDELPPNRQKVDTYVVRPRLKERVYNFVNKEILKGRQAYIICPLVEESDMLDAESAMETAQRLKKGYLKDVRLGLLHGRMKPDEKDKVMSEFKNGKIDVLVSTTVIEVGINVPNATVMVIENADRFGLAQLHQLRGRVGRGDKKSYCILISDMDTDESRMRMKIMQTISDGFKIAQKDMEIRGTGEFFGMRQHGLPELKLADIFRDSEILRLTNGLSKELLSSGAIYSDEYYKLRKKVMEKFKEKAQEVSFN
jgi:ATP-dependent DNA helicase RecG